jgi:membrane protease YdiL (CAAX protease family)
VNSLLAFVGLTYALSWAAFILATAKSGGDAASAELRQLVFLPGVFAPGVVALWLTWRAEGRPGTESLLNRVLVWQIPARWYLFALTYMAAIKLSVAVVHRVIIGEWPVFGQTPLYIMLGAILLSTPVQAGEEIGWRAYALPRLAKPFGLAGGSIILGVIWACWHLPLFFIPGTDTTGQSFPVYLLSVTALSVAMAWLYWRTSGSLLLTMLMHAAINNTKDVVPSSASSTPASPFSFNTSAVAWLTVVLLWLCAAYFVIRMRSTTLSGDRHQPLNEK